MTKFTDAEVAIVTGASSGIGAGTAIKLVQEGVTKLCLTGRNLEALKETKQKCLEESGNKIPENDIVLVGGDLTNGEVCSRIVSSTMEKFNRMDILVNNAGICKIGSFDSIPVSHFDEVINTNVRSMVVLTQLCVPHLKTQKGSIINVSSVLGLMPSRQLAFYCMSKAAIDMFTRCLSLELAPDGIRVNSVNPGAIPTQIGTRQGIPEETFDQIIEVHATINPLGRVGDVEEVASAIAFLASKESSYVNGTLLSIDGGWRNCLKDILI